MVRYAEGTFDSTQLQTQGVNFMEKTVAIRGKEVVFSIWDIGGHKDYESMLPLVCNDAAAILLMFDLTRNETLDSIRDWHRKARERNKCAMPVLIGVKFDQLAEMPLEEQKHVTYKARQFAEAIHAPLIFCAPSVPIHVSDVFKVILIQLFRLQPAVHRRHQLGEPLLEYPRRDRESTPTRSSSALREADSAERGRADSVETRHRSSETPSGMVSPASSGRTFAV